MVHFMLLIKTCNYLNHYTYLIHLTENLSDFEMMELEDEKMLNEFQVFALITTAGWKYWSNHCFGATIL